MQRQDSKSQDTVVQRWKIKFVSKDHRMIRLTKCNEIETTKEKYIESAQVSDSETSVKTDVFRLLDRSQK